MPSSRPADEAPVAHIIAPLPAMRKRTRLAKMVPFLLERYSCVQYSGWERERGEIEAFRWPDPRVRERAILRGGGYVSTKTRAMYPLWMLVVFWHVLWLGSKRTLLCLGWETAFPATLAAFFTGSRVIFDDADRFSMVLRLPAPIQRVVCFLERWTSHHVCLHVIPGWTRYDWKHERMLLLRNTPTTHDFEAARAMAPTPVAADLVVYVNGWIGQTRGAPVFLKAMQLLTKSGKNVLMQIAGRVDSADGRALIALPNVKFHGEIPQRLALALYPTSDVVLTLYDPAVPINRQAESNKWGDCVYFGIPFIVNQEVQTAASFVAAGAAWSVAYDDHIGLAQLLTKLADERELLADASAMLTDRFRAQYPPFDSQLKHVFMVDCIGPAETKHDA